MYQNINFLIPSISGGGAEKVTADLANMFAKENYRVSITCIYKKEKKEYYLDKKVKVNYLNSNKIIFSIFKLFFHLIYVKKSIVICSITPLNCIAALLNFLIKKHEIILMQHEIPSCEFNKGFLKKRLPFFIKSFYRFADSIICVSEGLKIEMLALLGCNHRQKLITIYNINSEKNYVRKNSNIKEKKLSRKKFINILSVGRLDKSKDFPSLIMAFSLFRKEINSLLTIIGSGPEKEALIELIKKLNIENHVNLIPFQKNLNHYYENSDIYVSSSAYESFGNTIVEAMTFGCHLVITDCKHGPKEICQMGKYAYIAKTKSYKDLFEKLYNCYKLNILPNYETNLERFSEKVVLAQFLKLPSFSK